MRASILVGLLALAAFVLPATASAASSTPRTYRVTDVRSAADRAAVARTGAAIVEVDHGAVIVTASTSDRRRLRRAGFKVRTLKQARRAVPKRGGRPRAGTTAFPGADANYHDYAEMSAQTLAVANAYPSIVQRFSIGTSYEGRTIWALKISDNVGTDENEPEVLFNANQHAREHLTVEMALYLLDELTQDYGSDTAITNAVNGREIWLVPMVNPDGVEYDIATGAYRMWRKNRQPNAGSSSVGTDLNRNWGWQWGCCGGSSGSFSSETYRGASAFSAPETQVLRDFVNSRVINGTQQIRAGIDIHTYSELILWPYGYTFNDTAPGLSADEQATFATLGRAMATTNGFTPEQSSDLYIADGTIIDWLWGQHKIFAYTFELYPTTSNPGFYPPDEAIPAQTSRNRAAVLMLLDHADCPYKAIGKEAQYCGGPDTTPPTVGTVTPAAGATNVATNAKVTVAFSEPMNQASAQSAFSLVRSSDSAAVAGSFSWSGNTMTFTPAAALSNSAGYAASVSTAAEDTAGNNLATATSWSFTTAAVSTTVTAFPSSATIQSGSLYGGNAASLNSDNNAYYQVSSTTSGTRTTAWYGRVTGVSNALTSLRVVYKGKNTASCSQTVALYNWDTATWVTLDTRSVSTTEVLIDRTASGTLNTYVSGTGTGDVAVRVRCTKTSNFRSQGDLMQIVYARP